jgi:hypothetical protein
LLRKQDVNIRFTSSLTPDDENAIAPALLRALASILDMMPIAYVIRIDTSDAKVYQHTGPLADLASAENQGKNRHGPVIPFR